MKNEPIKHHFIPRFILKNFCHNNDSYVNYFSIRERKTEKKKISDIFMERNLYRDEVNNIEKPTEIENNLAVYEGEVAKIIKDKILEKMK